MPSHSLLYGVTGIALFLAVRYPRQDTQAWVAYIIIALVMNIFTSVATMKMIVLLILSPWYSFLQKEPGTFPQTFPLVSVLIPAWNEEVGLLATIKTLLQTSYPYVEIVVVNDGSTDRSDEKMRAFLYKYNLAMDGNPAIPICYYSQANQGKGAALNTALQLAHGAILVTIDGDCAVDRDCLTNLVVAFADPKIMAVTGCIKIGNRRTFLGIVQSLEYAISLYARKADTLLDTIYVISGACGAFRREVFTQIGLYSTAHMTEDLDISFRMRRVGMRIAYAPEAIVYTEGAVTLKGLLRQRMRWVHGRFESFRTHKDLLFSRKQGRNKILTWVFLPLVLVNDWTAFFRVGLRLSLYLYYFLNGSFPLIALSTLICAAIVTPAVLNDQYYRRLAWLAPIDWLLFLVPSGIEFYAVLSAFWRLFRKRRITWQRWQRTGVFTK